MSEESVICEICKKAFPCINHLHLRSHKVSVAEYRERFPFASLICKNSLEKRNKKLFGRQITWADKISAGVSKSWEDNEFQGRRGIPLKEESRKSLSEKMKGHFVSEETRKKIALSGLGRVPWNKNLTKFDDTRLMSVSRKMSIWSAEHLTPERRALIGQSLKKRYAEGMPIPSSKGMFREDLKRYFRSSWESNFARVLNSNSVKWSYEKDRFKLLDENGDIKSTYVPDFCLEDGSSIEIKGHADSSEEWKCNCRRCERDKLKLSLMAEQFPEIKVSIFGRQEYVKMATAYCLIIPEWEHSSWDSRKIV